MRASGLSARSRSRRMKSAAAPSMSFTHSRSDAVDDRGVLLDDSTRVIRTDLETDNGIIHVIDGLLLPPGL